MRRLLADTAAVYVWLAVTLAGVAAAVVAGHAVRAVVGWAVVGIAAVVLLTNGPPLSVPAGPFSRLPVRP